MPQIRLEYCDSVKYQGDIKELILSVHNAVHEIADIDLNACKSRVVKLDNFFVGEALPGSAFVHLDIALLDGRPLEIRDKIGKACHKLLEEKFYPSNTNLKLQVTVEVREMLRSGYYKASN